MEGMIGIQSWVTSQSGNHAQQICRTYLGAYRDTLRNYSGNRKQLQLDFAQDLVYKFPSVFNSANSQGIANVNSIRLHLNALLGIAEGSVNNTQSYLKELEEIYC